MQRTHLLYTLMLFIFTHGLDSCSKKSNPNIELSYYEDGTIKTLTVNKVDKSLYTVFSFDKTGGIDSIENKKDSLRYGQSLWFNENGMLQNSAIFKDGKHNGQAFMFYDDGSIKNHRNWTNGKRYGYTTDFYQDSIGTLKNIYFYTDDTIEWWRPAAEHSAGISTSPTISGN